MPETTLMKMGNKQSILTYGRLRPLLPFSFRRYSRLPNSDHQEPLLLDEDYYERKEKQESEIEALREKNVRLEKNHGHLEKEIHKMQSIISRLESAARSSSKASQVASCGGCGIKTAAFQQGKDITQLRQELSDYEVIANKQKEAIQKLRQNSASLEHKVADLTTSLHQLKKKIEHSTQKSTKSRSSLPPRLTTSMTLPNPASEIGRSIAIVGNETVIGCLLALIFLISLLVGLNL